MSRREGLASSDNLGEDWNLPFAILRVTTAKSPLARDIKCQQTRFVYCGSGRSNDDLICRSSLPCMQVILHDLPVLINKSLALIQFSHYLSTALPV